MEKFMSNESLEILSSIISEIKESDEYKKVLLLKEEIDNDKDLVKLINDIKTLQKKYVNNKNDSDIKHELDMKNEELNKNSKFVEYNYYLDIVNKKIDLVRDKINDYFSNLVS